VYLAYTLCLTLILNPHREWWFDTSFECCVLQVEKIYRSHTIPSSLIQEGREVIRLRSTLQSLMERCSHISSELETFISDLASQTSVDSLDSSRRYVRKQPDRLTSRFAEMFLVYLPFVYVKRLLDIA